MRRQRQSKQHAQAAAEQAACAGGGAGRRIAPMADGWMDEGERKVSKTEGVAGGREHDTWRETTCLLLRCISRSPPLPPPTSLSDADRHLAVEVHFKVALAEELGHHSVRPLDVYVPLLH